nr:MAG TPA: hypothetical protein [Caudoviricetes sp.]
MYFLCSVGLFVLVMFLIIYNKGVSNIFYHILKKYF